MIQPDLFGGARAKPVASAPSLPATGQFVADPRGGASHFIHSCAVCGAPDAAFGSNVRLRAAIAAKDPRLAGTWLCTLCATAPSDGR
jgi:hypothetical protein